MAGFALPKSIRAVFFDIGFTLLFQNEEVTLAPLKLRGLNPCQEQLFAAERCAKRKLDDALLSGRAQSVDAQFWVNYHRHLMNELNIRDDKVLEELVSLSRSSANWNRTQPGTFDILRNLKQRFQLGVITNSDGRMVLALQKLGFQGVFDAVIDSGNVGHEKPEAEIFRAAAAAVNLEPQECLYVGDIYSVDYLGAKAIWMNSVLMDIARAYKEQDVPRVESLRELEARLRE